MNTRKVLVRLREKKVTANPAKTRLGLKEVEYVGHMISSTGTSFTEEKRLQVLDFPLPETEKAFLQFIGLANYFRDHVPIMTEMVQPLRKLMDEEIQGIQEVDSDRGVNSSNDGVTTSTNN